MSINHSQWGNGITIQQLQQYYSQYTQTVLVPNSNAVSGIPFNCP